ncbi:MAG: hypothetical protein K9H26_13800 [Prolixibacteraceae bacterium]|nr:hypothetical protein [Prolixibacteraceae bacterium]
MKYFTARNIGFFLIGIGLCLAVSLLFMQKSSTNKGFENETNYKIEPEIKILYPLDNCIFPPEISAPVFKWYPNWDIVSEWQISINTRTDEIYSAFVFETQWKPDSLLWADIKVKANFDTIGFKVTCMREIDSSLVPISSSVNFMISTDSVVAPLFFRKLDLPFNNANEHLSSVEWCLADISRYEKAKTLLTGVNLCGNCHSFSSDGKSLGIDFDYMWDKGGYAITELKDHTSIEKEDFFSWGVLSSKGESSSGFLSALSPNGRFVASTINDVTISSFSGNEFLFFPVKGMLGIFDRQTGESYQLTGANDPMYVQCNPTWSPDGENIIFSKAKALSASELNNPNVVNEFISGEREIRFDLWTVPFNLGKGGKARPVSGAGSNGKSNFFPRVSPDGKWIVFTQAKANMLRRMDSKLVIIPYDGGEARELESNLNPMNSWHAWSPNSKWIAFSTKGFNPYTKIALTHIDDSGHASPAVLLENVVSDKKAINLPEFVDIDFNKWNSIGLDFLKPEIIPVINLNNVKNGQYRGEAVLNGKHLVKISAKVEVVVEKGEIIKIVLLASKHIPDSAKKILNRVHEKQTINLFELGAGSNDEIVLIKAIENALSKGL